MDTAIICGLIILTVLILLLLAGVPIAAALGISSICAILPVMDADAAVLTGAQRILDVYKRQYLPYRPMYYKNGLLKIHTEYRDGFPLRFPE